MRYPKLRELKEAVKALVKGPYTTKFPYEPHTPYPKFRGKPIPDEKECVGCGACKEVCPSSAIEIKDNEHVRELIWHYDFCIFCGQCEANCTTKKGVHPALTCKGGVHLSNEWDLADFTRDKMFSIIKKELVKCENCGSIISTKEHILWLAKKLGPLAYGNLLLITSVQNNLQIMENIDGKVELPLRRPHLFRILCPKCKHQVVIIDQYGKQ